MLGLGLRMQTRCGMIPTSLFRMLCKSHSSSPLIIYLSQSLAIITSIFTQNQYTCPMKPHENPIFIPYSSRVINEVPGESSGACGCPGCSGCLGSKSQGYPLVIQHKENPSKNEKIYGKSCINGRFPWENMGNPYQKHLCWIFHDVSLPGAIEPYKSHHLMLI